MLRAFEERLKKLAVDPNDKFHLHIRNRVGKRATIVLEKRLKQLILMMPRVVSSIYKLSSKPELPSSVKRIGGFLLTYMYHPKDFLHEADHGFFGYLDDAYLAALVYERVLKEATNEFGGLTNTDQGLLERVKSLMHSAKIVIPKEAQAIDRMVEEILEGSQREFVGLFT